MLSFIRVIVDVNTVVLVSLHSKRNSRQILPHRAFLFYIRFFTYIKRTGRTQSLLHCFHQFFYTESYLICKKNQDNQKNFHVPSMHRAFLQCQFVDVFPMKLKNQLIVNLYYIQKVYSKWRLIYFLLDLETEICCFFAYPHASMDCIHCVT